MKRAAKKTATRVRALKKRTNVCHKCGREFSHKSRSSRWICNDCKMASKHGESWSDVLRRDAEKKPLEHWAARGAIKWEVQALVAVNAALCALPDELATRIKADLAWWKSEKIRRNVDTLLRRATMRKPVEGIKTRRMIHDGVAVVVESRGANGYGLPSVTVPTFETQSNN